MIEYKHNYDDFKKEVEEAPKVEKTPIEKVVTTFSSSLRGEIDDIFGTSLMSPKEEVVEEKNDNEYFSEEEDNIEREKI